MQKLNLNIWKFFIENFKFTIILIIGIIILGFISIITIPKESHPNIDIPIITIKTLYNGANSENVELFVTKVIEDRVKNISDIEEITSSSQNDISLITIRFKVNVDIDKKLQEVREEINKLKNELPEDIEEPIIKKLNFNELPILTLNISGTIDSLFLQQYAKQLKNEIETINGVSKVKIIGEQKRKIFIIVNKEKLNQYKLNITDITNAVKNSNISLPLGTIENNKINYTLNLKGKIKNIKNIENIPIKKFANSIIYIKDIAQVFDTYAEPKIISKIFLPKQSQELFNSISLQVFKVSGSNIIELRNKIDNKINKIKENLPNNIFITIIDDNAKQIKQDLNSLLKNGIQTTIIVFTLLLIFIGLREAILAGLIIPLTFFITFTFLTSLDYTLNFLTLFSLILSLGILVDNSIVVTEGINKFIKKGYSKKNATLETINDLSNPLIAGTLTTVFAFVPMLLSSGILGKYIRMIPITVSIVLLSSLFVALGLITTLGSIFLKDLQPPKPPHKQKYNIRKNIINKFINYIKTFYVKSFKFLCQNKIFNILFFLLLIILFISSLNLIFTKKLMVQMFPQTNQDKFYINYEFPEGTTLEQTQKNLQPIIDILKQDKRIQNFTVNFGSLFLSRKFSNIDQSNQAYILINLKEKTKRKQTSLQIINEYENKLAEFNKGKLSIIQFGEGPEQTAPIEITIYGDSLLKLEKLSKNFEDWFKQYPYTKNVQTSISEYKPEISLKIDKTKAQLYGINTKQIALILQNSITGIKATTIKTNQENIDILVKLNIDPDHTEQQITKKIDINTLEHINILTKFGQMPLSEFINLNLTPGQNEILHKNGKRIVKITAYTRNNIPAQKVFDDLEKDIQNNKIETLNNKIQIGGEREDIQKSFSDMFKAMFIGIILIALLLILQFKSYKQSLFILITIPLSIIAVFPGLLFLRLPLSFPAVIGIVALTGIVVNNAIILIDKINKNLKNTKSKQISILNAIEERFEPILLTTITTIFGILPLALKDEVWGPLGWSIIFGLSFSTILTLIVIPLLYYNFEKVNITT